MTEQEILNQIPDNWAEDIAESELEDRAAESWPSVIFSFAEKKGVKTTGSLEKIIIRIAKADGISKRREKAALKETCIANAKMDIFAERYGHLFPKDANGELSFSLPMLMKITGLPLEEEIC